MFRHSFSYLFYCFLIVCACKGKPAKNMKVEDDKERDTSVSLVIEKRIKHDSNIHYKVKSDTICYDTVRAYHYKANSWTDSVITDNYKAIYTVKVDTADPIIDTVKSLNCTRIMIGYNHLYSIDFSKNEKSWFNVSFNKKRNWNH